MIARASSTGGRRPAHHAVTHRGRTQHATLTAAFKGGGPNPKIPAKYRAKPKPSPSFSLKLPTVGKVTGKSGGIATPAVSPVTPGSTGRYRATIPHPTGPVSPYVNPFASSGPVTGQRIDQGVDYTGRPGATIGALGPGKIVSAQASGSGWPGGGFIGEQLTAGPAKGQVVYTAEDVRPLVITGQTVKAGQPIGAFTPGGSIEAGWGTLPPNVGQALAYGKQSAPGSDPGAYSTGYGIAFDRLIRKLGGPAGVMQSTVSGSAPPLFSATGGKVPGPHHVSLPPAPLPNFLPHGVNPPASGGVGGGPELVTGGPPTRQRRGRRGHLNPPTLPPVFPRQGTPPSVTTITSSKGTGGVAGVAAPSTGSGGGGGMLLLLAGAAVVVILLVMRKKGKGKK